MANSLIPSPLSLGITARWSWLYYFTDFTDKESMGLIGLLPETGQRTSGKSGIQAPVSLHLEPIGKV